MTTIEPWQQRVGHPRDWIWRGWRVRYTYLSRATPDPSLPLLFLHGFGASIGHWRSNLPVLCQQHPVYALDLLGFGASQKAEAVYGTALWVEQVYAFWQEFIRRPVVLVGNSLGSVVCVGLAAKHPEMVAGIALLNLPDFSAVGIPGWIQAIVEPIGNVAKRCLTVSPIFVPLFRLIRRPGVIRAWAQGAYCNRQWVDDELVEILSHPAHEVGAARTLAAMVRSQRQLPAEYTARFAFPKLQIPILLVWGTEDTMVPATIAQKFVEFNPAITLVRLPDTGHCPHDERPETVNSLLLDWIGSWTVDSEPTGCGTPR